MNCGDFRYLVQRRFDEELSPPDDRALLIHLETCESCQKFYHQVQQVIIAAKDMEVPPELLPPRPEFLASGIIEHIPQAKPGLAGTILGFLSRLADLLPGRQPRVESTGEEISQADFQPLALHPVDRCLILDLPFVLRVLRLPIRHGGSQEQRRRGLLVSKYQLG